MKTLFAAVGVVGLVVGVAIGDPTPTSSASAPSVSELVARLGSEDYRTREEAVAALAKAGPEAIPALRAAMKSDSPEVRLRAGAIVHKLQRAADSSARLAPKKVALNYQDLALGNAVNDLRTRTGLNLVLDPRRVNPLRKVTCVTDELPVWEALDAFCVAAGLTEVFRDELDVPKAKASPRGYTPAPLVPMADAVPITFVEGKHTRLPGDRRTAVRVLALPPSFPGHRVTLGGDTTLCFDIAPFPGLNWQDVTGVRITRLIDDAGRSGAAGTPKSNAPAFNDFDGIVAFGGGWGGQGAFMVGGGGMRFDPRTGQPIYPDTMPNPRVLPVPLKIATPTARSLKRLEGAIIGEITLTNQTLITVNDPAKHPGSAFNGLGNVRLTVVSVGEPKGNSGPSMQVLLEYPSPWSVAARRGWNPGGIWPESPRLGNQMPTVQAYDAAGKVMRLYQNNGFSDTSGDGQTMHYRYDWTFPKGSAPPAKLVVSGPRPMIVEVPFVMENVPLP